MSAAKTPLAGVAARYNALSPREKAMVALALVFGPLLVGNSLFVDPPFAKARSLRQAVEQQRLGLADAKAQIANLEAQLQVDPDAPKKAELAGVQQKLLGADERLKKLSDSLVPPAEMNHLLEHLLAKHGGLRLVSLKTLAPESILTPPAKAEDKPAERQFDIFRHGIELRLEGGYFELLAYLDQLEKAEKKLLWGPVRLTVETHPKALLTVTVYTLAADRAWLSL